MTIKKLLEICKCKRYVKVPPAGLIANSIILITTKQIHNSGYPYIQTYFIDTNTKTLYKGGKHDNIKIEAPVNIDSFTPNVMHIWHTLFSIRSFTSETLTIESNYEVW